MKKAVKKSNRKLSTDGEKLELRYIPLSQALLWDKNPKKHDYGAISESIKRNGFKDPPKFEPKLNGGKGGIVEGNGRLTTLRDMRMNSEKRPRGIIEDDKTEWLIPVLFGVDAASQKAAEAYAIDHNNITILGGDFGMYDIAKMWDEKAYAEILKSLEDVPPISMDSDDIIAYLGAVDGTVIDKNKEWQGMPEFEQDTIKAFQTIIIRFKEEKDVVKFSNLIKQNITPQTKSLWFPKQDWDQLGRNKIYET